MQIGIVRHFKVLSSTPKKMLNSKEFDNLMDEYDNAPVKPNMMDINSNEWNICYVSTLQRAITTAETLYKGEIIRTPLIIEVPLSAFIKTETRLGYLAWQVFGRIAWLFSLKSQPEGRPQSLARIRQFITIIENSGYQNILIVSHGFFMKIFVRELKKHGFRGELDFSPKNGKLYRFKKE